MKNRIIIAFCFVSLRNGRSAPILIDPYGWARMTV